MLTRTTEFCYRHRRLVVAAWVLVLAVTAMLPAAGSAAATPPTTARPGSESVAATNLLDERFPARSGDTIDVVWRADDVPLPRCQATSRVLPRRPTSTTSLPSPARIDRR